MKKISIIGGLLMVAIIAVAFLNIPSKKPSLAIVTTLSHQALDDVRDGIKTSLKTDLQNFDIKEYNAEGNMAQANLIAQQISADQTVKGIFTIGTLAAQAMAKVEHTRPIVVAAVSDPTSITAEPQANICGVSDGIDADYQIGAIAHLLPSIKKLALLYSPHEANSAASVKKLIQAAEKAQLTATTIGILDAQQIMPASLKACQDYDAIVVPLDNQIVAGMPLVIKATANHPCPVITSNQAPIEQGATIAFGVDYTKSGSDAAAIMMSILSHHQSAQSIGFKPPKNVGLYLNSEVIKKKNLSVDRAWAAEHGAR